MSTREEMIEDAKRDAWEARRERRYCSTCRQSGGHHSACPDNDEEPDAIEDEDDAEDEE